MSMKITDVILQPYLPGDSELILKSDQRACDVFSAILKMVSDLQNEIQNLYYTPRNEV